MKSNRLFILLILSLILFNSINSQQVQNKTAQQPSQNTTEEEKKQQDPLPNHIIVQLDKPYPQQLNKDQQYQGKFRINIPQNKINQLKEQKWYLFVEVETAEQFQWEKTKIQLFTINQKDTQKPLKQCDTINGLDSCFLTNKNFDYKNEKIQARVTCEQFCKFTLSAQVSSKYKLNPNQALELNFQNTAYSKLFSLDTNSLQDFKRLEIILKPSSFLNFNAPIRLFANKGEIIPTRQKHDYAGIHLWDDGLGIFVNFPEASNLFTILIEGPEKNILTLETKLINQTKPIQTVRYQPYFAFVQAKESQLFKIKIDKKQKTYIKLTTLTGAIQMSGIKDQSMKDIQMEFSTLARSYGQLQYKFDPSFFQKNKDFNITEFLYIKIKGLKDSTFVFESYTNDDLMNYLVPEVNRYAQLLKQQSDIYYFKLLQIQENINSKNQQARIQIMTTTYSDVNLQTKLFLCKADQAKDCQPTKQEVQKLRKNQSIDNDKRTQLKNVPVDTSLAGVQYFDLTVNYKQFVKKQGVYHVYVITVITNPKEQQILYTLQYVDMGTTYFLKQKQLKRDRLSIDQLKYYTFINNDKDVKSIRIHSIQISGEILMVGYKEDPRLQPIEGKQIYEYHGSVTFLDVKPGEQMFLQIQGIDNAYYSLYLQLIRQSQNNPDNKGNQGYNQIIIQENVAYDFFIKPKEKLIIQLQATVPQFQLYVGSHLPLELCLTQILDKPPFSPNCEIVQTLTKNERIGLIMDKGLIGNMGVTNNNDRAVEFKVQVRPKSKTPPCSNAPLSILNKVSIPASNATNQQTVCYKFNLNRRQTIEFIVELNNMEYDNATIYWQLNDKQKQILMSPRHLIWNREIKKICGQRELQKCELTILITSNYSTDAEIVVQYIDRDIILLDGMAQPAWIPIKTSESKNYRYELINHVNTTVLLQNKAGYYHFYGKIISRKDFYAANRSTVYPTQKDHLFKSDNPFYYLYQVYQLTQKQIKDSNCTQQCVLLISVVPLNNEDNEEPGRFTIQVSQEDRYLKQNQPIMGFLQRQSLAFYQYYNPKPGTIYVQLSNQNINCAKIFLKKGNQSRATPSSYDKVAQNQNSLIYEDAQAGPYAITVQAKGKHQGCSYSIQVISSEVKIARIKRGIFNDKILQVNQSYHFIYEHYKNESFKILTLNKLGELMIKIKVLYEGQLNKLLSTNSSQLKSYLENIKYQDSNIDFLKVHHKKTIYFCMNCTYLISVMANKYTQTSIVIPSKDVQIPIIQDATLKDQLKQKQITKFRIFTGNLAQYKLYVQYGKINVTIVQSISDKVVISKIYQQTKEPIYEKFNSSTSGTNEAGFGYDFIHYSILTIQGIANSSFYSFQLLSTKNQQQNGGNVKCGIPQFFFLQPKQTKCFKGIIDDESQQFILSFDDSSKQQIKNLKFTCKVKDIQVKYNTTFGVSEMTLQINDLKITEPTPYEICLASNQTLSLTFIQSAHIMMIPSDTAILMTHPLNFTFGSKGTTLLQIDECSEKSITSISSSFNDLHTAQTQINQVRRGNNLIQFYYWGPIYVHLETSGSRIRWRNKDTYTQLGLGYQKFATGSAIAYKDGDNIKIQVKPIQQAQKYTKQAKQRVTEISYKIVLVSNTSQLSQSLNCYEPADILKFEHKTQSLNNDLVVATFPINEQMKQKFSSQKYFLVGILANLNIDVNGTIENYRFIYPMIDVQRQVLMGNDYKPVEQKKQQNQGTSKDKFSEMIGYLIILIGVIVFIIVLYLVYTKWIRRWLRRRKDKLSDQGSSNFKYTEFASMDAA